MKYGQLLGDSGRIWFKHKGLWLFGMLLALATLSRYGVSVDYYSLMRFQMGAEGSAPRNALNRIVLSNPLAFILGAVAVYLVLWLITNLIGALARGGLIDSVRQAITEGGVSMPNSWRAGWSRLGPMYAISLLVTLPTAAMLAGAIGLLVVTVDFTSRTATEQALNMLVGAACAYVGLACIGVIIALLLGAIEPLALRACVVERLSFGQSLARGWRLLWRHFGYMLLTGVLLYLAQLGYALLVSIPVPGLWEPVRGALMGGVWSEALTPAALGFAAYVLFFSIVAGGILMSFNETLWTRLYAAFMEREAAKAAEVNAPAAMPAIPVLPSPGT